MLRVLVTLVVLVSCFCQYALAKQFDPQDLVIRNLLLEAFRTTSPQHRKAKLEEILKKSPENYHALVKMAEIEENRGASGLLDSREFLLRAALQQPDRPEAYLALAQSYYERGDVPGGDRYMIMGLKGPYGKLSYEGACLQGQLELDTCNYYAAVITFGKAALSPQSPYRNDAYLMRKLYYAASMSKPPSYYSNDYWVPYIYAKLLNQSYGLDDDRFYQEVLKDLRRVNEKIRARYPQLPPYVIQKVLNSVLYSRVMATLRNRVGATHWIEAIGRDRFDLPDNFYNFGVCPQEEVAVLQPNLDLYDVFIEASVSDPRERAVIKKKLMAARDKALEAVAGIKDPTEKGRKLFQWLRENLIKEYDAVDGITAQGIVNDKKYLCLSGAIVYTLMGRDAGLDVNGFVQPGHAYAVLHDKKGDKINVETTYPVRETAEFPAGFGAASRLAGMRGATLRATPDIVGEVSPIDLVSYQYINVGLNKLDNLTLNKYNSLLREVLKEAGYSPVRINEFIKDWRNATLSPGMQFAIMATMSVGSDKTDETVKKQMEKYHGELMREIDRMMDDHGKARAFNPFNKEFMTRLESIASLYTHLLLTRPASAMVKRLKDKMDEERRKARTNMEQEATEQGSAEGKRAANKDKEAEKEKDKDKEKDKKAKQKAETPAPAKEEEQPPTTAPTVAEEPVTESEAILSTDVQTGDREIAQWEKEKKVWLHSLDKLEAVVRNHPCSERLKRNLAEHCLSVIKVLTIAKMLNGMRENGAQMDYSDLVRELNRIRTEYFASDTDVSVRLGNAISEAL